MQGINLTSFIIFSAKKEAESILKQQTLINLSLRDITTLLESNLKNDEVPGRRLVSAVERFKSFGK